jgi:hypothetical protein
LTIGDAEYGYSSGSLLNRIRYLRFDDLSRFAFILFPTGLLPALALPAWRWQDRLARLITLTSLGYFGFFFFQAFVALHHFVPVMILPLVVFWRIYLYHQNWFRRVSLPAIVATSIVAMVLSLPRHFELNHSLRSIGQKTAYLAADYHSDYRQVVKHNEILFELMSPDWKVEDPANELVGSANSIVYYAALPKPAGTSINYIVQDLSEPTPTGFTQVADDQVVALYVRDAQEWQADRFRSLRTDYRSRLYDIPRTTLFAHWWEQLKGPVFDLKYYLSRLKSMVSARFSPKPAAHV